MTVGVPDIFIYDLPQNYQHHTVGFSGLFGRLIYKVARVVMCFHEHEDKLGDRSDCSIKLKSSMLHILTFLMY